MDLDDAEQRALLVEERKRGTDRRLLRVRATAGVVFAVAILVTFFGGLESGRWTESDAGFGNDMFWMEGSDPIGWEGDAADLFSYLWGSPGPTIGVEIDTRSHRGVYDYLASVVPPPAGNGFTARDGSQTPDADAGEALFAGAAGCVGCHAGPMVFIPLRGRTGYWTGAAGGSGPSLARSRVCSM